MLNAEAWAPSFVRIATALSRRRHVGEFEAVSSPTATARGAFVETCPADCHHANSRRCLETEGTRMTPSALAALACLGMNPPLLSARPGSAVAGRFRLPVEVNCRRDPGALAAGIGLQRTSGAALLVRRAIAVPIDPMSHRASRTELNAA